MQGEMFQNKSLCLEEELFCYKVRIKRFPKGYEIKNTLFLNCTKSLMQAWTQVFL